MLNMLEDAQKQIASLFQEYKERYIFSEEVKTELRETAGSTPHYAGYGKTKLIVNDGPIEIKWSEGSRIATAKYSTPTYIMSTDGLLKEIASIFSYRIKTLQFRKRLSRPAPYRDLEYWPKLLKDYLEHGRLSTDNWLAFDRRSELNYMMKHEIKADDKVIKQLDPKLVEAVMAAKLLKTVYQPNFIAVLKSLSPFQLAEPVKRIRLPAVISSDDSRIMLNDSQLWREDAVLKRSTTLAEGPMKIYIENSDKVSFATDKKYLATELLSSSFNRFSFLLYPMVGYLLLTRDVDRLWLIPLWLLTGGSLGLLSQAITLIRSERKVVGDGDTNLWLSAYEK